MPNSKGPGCIEITFEFSRYVSPRYVHGGVTLSFDSFKPYKFISQATWTRGGNYETAVREAVEQILLEQQGNLDNTEVVLKRITWDDVASCEFAFRQAAKVATRSAFVGTRSNDR